MTSNDIGLQVVGKPHPASVRGLCVNFIIRWLNPEFRAEFCMKSCVDSCATDLNVIR